MLLDALRDGPKHGYEIIKALEERSSGQYAPSPGTVYPTLQYLEDLGLVRSEQAGDRRVYHLTEAGRAALDAHAEEVAAFWSGLKSPDVSAAVQAELGFLRDEIELLVRTVRGGLHSMPDQVDAETIRRLRQAVENCRNEARRILTTPEDGPTTNA